MKVCETCHQNYDESKVIHIPLESEQARGMMTIRFVTGCKEIPMEKKA